MKEMRETNSYPWKLTVTYPDGRIDVSYYYYRESAERVYMDAMMSGVKCKMEYVGE